jgi:hypothetical protein
MSNGFFILELLSNNLKTLLPEFPAVEDHLIN